ncbi:MAG: hypothetical protein V7K57_21725 [Nostoc sp.]|uniref:hypothetical protein n=1 Tax=Nostoc sp. TaxID=1180 RepID=UPI002FF504E4
MPGGLVIILGASIISAIANGIRRSVSPSHIRLIDTQIYFLSTRSPAAISLACGQPRHLLEVADAFNDALLLGVALK